MLRMVEGIWPAFAAAIVKERGKRSFTSEDDAIERLEGIPRFPLMQC